MLTLHAKTINLFLPTWPAEQPNLAEEQGPASWTCSVSSTHLDASHVPPSQAFTSSTYAVCVYDLLDAMLQSVGKALPHRVFFLSHL
jgi:hypothetical protein